MNWRRFLTKTSVDTCSGRQECANSVDTDVPLLADFLCIQSDRHRHLKLGSNLLIFAMVLPRHGKCRIASQNATTWRGISAELDVSATVAATV